jgi:hypothetical protein
MMNLPMLRLPQRFAAYFEIRTRHGIVNRETGFHENDHPSDYTLIAGIFTAERMGRGNYYVIRCDRQMGYQLFHDAQLIRDGNTLNQYGDGTYAVTNGNTEPRNNEAHGMRFCVTPYTAYVDTNGPEHLPIVLFDYRTTERLMDQNCPHVRMTMPNRSWIRHLLLERRNLVEDGVINDPIIDTNNHGGVFNVRRRQWNEGAAGGDWGGGGGGAAGGGAAGGEGYGGGRYGAGGYGIGAGGGGGGGAAGGSGNGNYYQPYPNHILNTYYSILPPAAGGAAGGAPAGGGPASRRHSITNDEQEGGAGRPLETFVAEALLREAIRTNMTCAISMEPVEHRGFVVTNCFHIFQREALEQWAESHTNCPVCRAALVYRPVNVTLPQ